MQPDPSLAYVISTVHKSGKPVPITIVADSVVIAGSLVNPEDCMKAMADYAARVQNQLIESQVRELADGTAVKGLIGEREPQSDYLHLIHAKGLSGGIAVRPASGCWRVRTSSVTSYSLGIAEI
jgi:hypothetical protein